MRFLILPFKYNRLLMIKDSIIKITILFGLICSFSSCQEIFNPDLDIEAISLPCVEAVITDSSSLCFIYLRENAEFNARYNKTIDDAVVTLSIDSLESEQFESSSGYRYIPESEGFVAEYGKEYSLNILLNDGSEYISEPCTLPPPADSLRFYIEPGVNNYISTNIYGEVKVNEITGYNAYLDILSSQVNSQYYRQDIKIVYQYVYYVQVGFFSIPVYAWQIRGINDIPIAQRSVNNGKMNVVMREDINFLNHVKINPFKEMETRTITGYIQSGWVVLIDNYSINKEAYLYYDKIDKQLNAKNQYFDPVPSQIFGNIHDVENPENLAFGLFELSNVETKVFYITSHSYDHDNIYELENYHLPSSLSGTVDGTMPDFFVNEYFLK